MQAAEEQVDEAIERELSLLSVMDKAESDQYKATKRTSRLLGEAAEAARIELGEHQRRFQQELGRIEVELNCTRSELQERIQGDAERTRLVRDLAREHDRLDKQHKKAVKDKKESEAIVADILKRQTSLRPPLGGSRADELWNELAEGVETEAKVRLVTRMRRH